MGELSIWHWLIVLAIVVMVFGTKKLKNMGSDLGEAVKGFKQGMKSAEDEARQAPADPTQGQPPAQIPASDAAAAQSHAVSGQAAQDAAFTPKA